MGVRSNLLLRTTIPQTLKDRIHSPLVSDEFRHELLDDCVICREQFPIGIEASVRGTAVSCRLIGIQNRRFHIVDQNRTILEPC